MPDLGALLLYHARAAITHHLGLPVTPCADDLPELHRLGATFVTLTQRGDLRGCIGSLLAHRPLLEDVRRNACNAAFSDPRFPPLGAHELAGTRVEVSLLTPPEPLQFQDEADARAQLRPHVDGVIFSARGQRSTFLPQVWEQLPEPRQFIEHLRIKAGLPLDAWPSDMKLGRYLVTKYR